ncbi:MAG: hypothetical protein RJA52_80 [Bacteroidota bacterium]
MRIFLILSVLSLNSVFTFAQKGPSGIWKTIDDATGEAKSHVEIYESKGKYYGKVVKLLQNDAVTICSLCPGNKKNQKVLGMNVIEGLENYRDYWKGGTILDPKNGNEYSCSVWFDDGEKKILKVRGKHWSGLFRTQTWYRVEN